MQQKTVARRVAYRGTGLHRGEQVEIALCPAPVDTGIVFVSLGAGADGRDVEIPARAENVRSTARATTLAAATGRQESPAEPACDASIATVEHLLATLFALQIDNARVEVRGSEIPAFDGSAAPLLDWVRLAGFEEQDAARRVLSIDEPLEIREGDRMIRVEPAEQLGIFYAIDFDHPRIGRQVFEIAAFDEAIFESELAAARTFGFADEVDALREAGLARGGSFDNTVVLGATRVLNPDGLRWPDEFVRHKVIDLLGDLALLGGSLNAHVRVEKGGHRLHHRLVRALLEQPLRSPATGDEALGDREPGRTASRLALARS